MSPPDVSPGTPGQPIQSLPSDAFIVVPVRNTVLFPEIVFPITLGRPATIAAAQQAVREQRQILIVLQRQPETDDPKADDLYRVGTVTNIVRYVTTPDGNHMVICQGAQRFPQDAPQREPGGVERELAGLDLGKVEQVVDHVEEGIGLTV